MRGAKTVAAKPVVAKPRNHGDDRATSSSHLLLIVCHLALVLLVLAVYGQVGRGAMVFWPGEPFEFIALDDPDYISENADVRRGLSTRGLRWAFGQTHVGNWHPLTWLSLMLDCQLFGLNPAGPHLTNALLHLANVLLLFTLLQRMTSQAWPMFLVAALCSVHPLHAESVAWVSERKDVLSTCFALLAMLAYERYARRPGVGRYLLVLIGFMLSLLAKQMWVTLPCVLLLLDFWPLRRLSKAGGPALENKYWPANWSRLVWEKIPLFALSIGFSTMIYVVQHAAGAMSSAGDTSLSQRLPNVAISYWMYFCKTFWPTRLAVMYPYSPAELDWLPAILCALANMAITLLAIWRAQRWPWLAVGWFWFLGTLVPVIGLVPIGSHAWADRYSYGPQIGLLIAVIWSAAAIVEWLEVRANRQIVVAGAVLLAIISLLSLMIQGHRQVSIWQNTERLFSHTIAVTQNNDEFELTLAGYLATKKQYAEAEQRYQAILQRAPDNLTAQLDLGALWFRQGRVADATQLFTEATHRHPTEATAHARLAGALHAQGRISDAISAYEIAIELRPDWPNPRNDLAWLLATEKSPAVRSADRAVALAEAACQLTDFQDPNLLDTLAAAYAESGKWDEATRIADQAIQLARSRGHDAVATDIASRAELYRRQQPFRAP